MRYLWTATALIVATGIGVGLGGCATVSSPPGPPTSIQPTASRLVAPIVVHMKALNGTTMRLPRNSVLDIAPSSDAVDGWKATMEPRGVAVFHDGSIRGDTVTNPGISPLKAGSTVVTLTHAGGAVISFILEVVPAPNPDS